MSINAIKNEIEVKLSEYSLNNQNLDYISIIVEELLLLYKEDISNLSFEVNKNSKELYIKLTIPGDKVSPRELEEKIDVYLLDITLSKTDFIIKHEYINNCNVINISLERYYTILNNMKFAFSYLKNDKKSLFFAWFFNLVAIAANLVVPYASGKLVTSLTENIFKQIVISAGLLLVCRMVYALFIGYSIHTHNYVNLPKN